MADVTGTINKGQTRELWCGGEWKYTNMMFFFDR